MSSRHERNTVPLNSECKQLGFTESIDFLLLYLSE
jgi:hypothetical protein